MILVTGAASFVGRSTVRHLAAAGYEVCCLLRPSQRDQRLPTGITLSTASAPFTDPPALRVAMRDVTTIVHLLREEETTQKGTLYDHVQGTASLITAAQEVGVRRFIQLSRLGADRASAYPLFRTKGEAEALVRESGLDYTILQATLVYGASDVFTNMLVMLAKMIPLILPLPNAGMSRFQPLWVEDLAACITDTIERDELVERVVPVGGPEHFTLKQMVAQILEAAGMNRLLFHMGMPLLRGMIRLFEALLVYNPTPEWWLDVVAAGSATELGVISRHFDFEPERFSQRLGYLRRKRPWRRDFLRFVLDY